VIDPRALIADLDNMLTDGGTPARLVRSGSSPYGIDCIVTLRGYSPSELIAGSDITQQDQQFVLSPTALIAGNWPGPGAPRGGDPLIPRRDDRIVANRVTMTIQAAAGVYVQGVLVRIDGRVRGSN
jgi:hypothetical protein